MKLAYSKPALFEFNTRAVFIDGVLNLRWNDGFTGANPTVQLTEEFVRSYIGSKELSDATNIYVLTNEDGNFVALRSKMSQSFLNKQSGFEYTRQHKVVVAAQIYIPFSDTPFSEWTIRVNFKPSQELPAEFADAQEVGTTLEDFHNFAYSIFPSLKVVNKTPIANGEKITVQLTKDGLDTQKGGVRIFAKSSSGYLAKTEVYTDERGQATFTALTLGLDAGDTMKPEFGFKWVTNLTNTDVVAS